MGQTMNNAIDLDNDDQDAPQGDGDMPDDELVMPHTSDLSRKSSRTLLSCFSIFTLS